MRIRKRGAAREAEIHVPRVGGDITKHVLHLSAEAEPDRNRVHLIDRLRGVGRLFEHYLAQRESEFRDMPVIRRKELKQLGVGRTSPRHIGHARTEYTSKSELKVY